MKYIKLFCLCFCVVSFLYSQSTLLTKTLMVSENWDRWDESSWPLSPLYFDKINTNNVLLQSSWNEINLSYFKKLKTNTIITFRSKLALTGNHKIMDGNDKNWENKTIESINNSTSTNVYFDYEATVGYGKLFKNRAMNFSVFHSGYKNNIEEREILESRRHGYRDYFKKSRSTYLNAYVINPSFFYGTKQKSFEIYYRYFHRVNRNNYHENYIDNYGEYTNYMFFSRNSDFEPTISFLFPIKMMNHKIGGGFHYKSFSIFASFQNNLAMFVPLMGNSKNINVFTNGSVQLISQSTKCWQPKANLHLGGDLITKWDVSVFKREEWIHFRVLPQIKYEFLFQKYSVKETETEIVPPQTNSYSLSYKLQESKNSIGLAIPQILKIQPSLFSAIYLSYLINLDYSFEGFIDKNGESTSMRYQASTRKAIALELKLRENVIIVFSSSFDRKLDLNNVGIEASLRW